MAPPKKNFGKFVAFIPKDILLEIRLEAIRRQKTNGELLVEAFQTRQVMVKR